VLSKSVAEAPTQDNFVTEIAAALRLELVAHGVISFARFMEIALYCPEIGYYEQEQNRIGAAGDFYTSVNTGPLFGELLARQFLHWAETGPPLRLVEAGAHSGQLARDILSWLKTNHPHVFDQLEYSIVEPSPRRRLWQERTLELFAGRVHWSASITDLPARSLDGIIFSNELLDAFPVHRLGWKPGTGWFEWGVAWDNGKFVWRPLPCACHWAGVLESAGFRLPPELEAVLPEGFVLEVSPAAGQWWRESAAVLRRGRLMTIDYGYWVEEFLRPERAGGTLRAYSRHRHAGNVLDAPGTQDLTAHVNFTQLVRAGEAEGLHTDGLLAQSRFLTPLVEAKSREQALTAAEVRQFHTLTHPEHLGSSFRVLVQSRAAPPIRS
jgi:SAM-dependent MidA family methyltransferase